MIRRGFCSKVHVGNWMEESLLDEERQHKFQQNEHRGILLHQKLNSLAKRFFEDVSLSVCPDGLIHFGDVVQIVHENLGLKPLEALAIHVPSMDIVDCSSPCRYYTCATKCHTPMARNTFTIIGTAEEKLNRYQSLLYGDPFMLRASLCSKIMFLHSNMMSLGSYSTDSQHQETSLTASSSCHNVWKALPGNREFCLDFEGKPVRTTDKVIITHVLTNQYLCLKGSQLRTVFGIEEEVTAHTYPARPQNVDRRNLWRFATALPRP